MHEESCVNNPNVYKLKPCPFCGELPEINVLFGYIRCNSCNFEIFSRSDEIEEVVKKWNTRYMEVDEEEQYQEPVPWQETGFGRFLIWLANKSEQSSKLNVSKGENSDRAASTD